MTSILSRALAALRVFIGLNDPVDTHLYPSHGWWLPASGDVRARALAFVPVPVPAVSAPGKRR